MKRFYINMILACSLAASLVACTDVWDDHYQVNPALNGGEHGDKTLWELISSDSELEVFARLLTATKCDSLLMYSRNYTVWAPTGLSADELQWDNDSMLAVYKKEIVENHIANYSHVAGGDRNKEDKKNYDRIEMLNGKFCDFEGRPGKAYTFAGNRLLNDSNIVTKNGVLHKIEGYAVFSSNIWEQMAKEPSISKFYNFLAKDNKTVFDEANSVKGSIVDGKVTYLDSVFKEECRWFERYNASYIGGLNIEDSSYTVYAPTNAAWEDLCSMMKKYYNYPDVQTKDEGAGTRPIQEYADSVLVEDLVEQLFVFSNTVNKKFYEGRTDTLRSTSYNYFIGDAAYNLENGCEKEVKGLSNGNLHIIGQVNYDPFKLWFDTIRVMGTSLTYKDTERADKFVYATSKPIPFERGDSLYNRVEGHSVCLFTANNDYNSNEQPKFRFYVDNILSGSYKISIVLVPYHFVVPTDTLMKPNKFKAKLYCPDGKGGSNGGEYLVNSDESLGTTFKSDPSVVDTIMLAKKFKFDYCEMGYETMTGNKPVTYLEIETDIKFGGGRDAENVATRTNANTRRRNPKYWKYDNSYCISQVLFEPVED